MELFIKVSFETANRIVAATVLLPHPARRRRLLLMLVFLAVVLTNRLDGDLAFVGSGHDPYAKSGGGSSG